MKSALDLTVGNVPHTLLRFFWPLLLANVLQSLYRLFYLILLVFIVGSVGLAAISNASMIVFVVTALAIGVGTGGTVRLAMAMGAGRSTQGKTVIDSMAALSLVLSLVVTAALLIWLQPALLLMRVPPEAMADTVSYLRIVALGTVFVFGFNAAGSLLRGMGDSRRPMHFIVVATIVNVALDLLFVGPLGKGVAGAAYATVASQAVACLAAWRCLHTGAMVPNPAEAMAILRIGIPSALQLVAVNISYVAVTAMLNTYGVAVAAASGIGLKVNTFAAMPCWAFGYALTAVVGQCLGAGKKERAASALWHGQWLNLVFTSALVLAVNLAAEPIMRIFDPGSPEVLRIGIRYLRLCCSINCLVYCAMYMFDAFATGAGHAVIALGNSLLDSFLIRLSLGWLLGIYWGYGYEGIYLAQALGPVLPALLGFVYYLSKRWEKVPGFEYHPAKE